MKSKRIFSISIVKNEVDIIESFVRYNVNVVDGMIILDNNSTDTTLKILKLLKNEGLPLFIFEDENIEFNQADKTNMLLLKAINEFKADIILPLDADEFIISSNNGNPRELLEKIESDSFYHVRWKTYIPDFSNEQEKFIPAKITLARADNAQEMHKVILPKELVKNYGVKLTKGNHNLVFNRKYNDSIKRILSTDLRIAHFPMRSKEQAISKISVGWLNSLWDIKRRKNESWHLQKMFNELKNNWKLDNEDIINFAKVYSSTTDLNEIKIEKNPIDLTFCGNMEIKYTDNEISPLYGLLDNCEKVSLDYLNFKKISFAKEKQLKIQIKNLKNQITNLEKERIAEEKKLKSKIKNYKNSTSWRVTSPLRKIGNILRNLGN